MAELPRYRGTGIQPIAPPQVRRPSGTQRSAMLVNEIGRMQQFVEGRLREERIREGQQAVTELGEMSVLEQISARGGPRSQAERSAWELANQIGADRLENEARIEMARIIESASPGGNATTPYETVNGQLADVVDGFAATLSNFDPSVSAQLRARLDNHAATLNMNYLSAHNQLQIDGQIVNDLSLATSITSDIENIIRTNGGITEEAAPMIERVMNIYNRDYIQPKDRNTYIQQFSNQLIRTQQEVSIFSTDENGLYELTYEEREDKINDLRAETIGTLTEPQKNSFINSLDSLNRSIRQREVNDLNNLLEEESIYIEANKTVPLWAADLDVIEEYNGTEARVSVESSRNAVNIIGNAYTQTNESLNAILDDLQSLSQQTIDPQTDVINDRTYAAAQALIAAEFTERATQSVDYAIKNNPAIQNAFENYLTNLTPESYSEYNSLVVGYWDSINLPEEQRRTFTAASATNIANYLNGSIVSEAQDATGQFVTVEAPTSTERINLINGLRASLPEEQYSLALEELINSGLNADIAEAIYLPDSLPGLEEAREILFVVPTLTRDEVYPTADNGTQIANNIERSIRNDTEDFKNLYYSTQADGTGIDLYNEKVERTVLAAGYLMQTNNMKQGEARRRAIEMVFNETVIEKSLIPRDLLVEMSSTNVNNVLEYLKSPQQLTTYNIDPLQFTELQDVNEEVTREYLSLNAVLLNNETGDGLVLGISPLQGPDIPVKTRDGNYIEFKFNDLNSYVDRAIDYTATIEFEDYTGEQLRAEYR